MSSPTQSPTSQDSNATFAIRPKAAASNNDQNASVAATATPASELLIKKRNITDSSVNLFASTGSTYIPSSSRGSDIASDESALSTPVKTPRTPSGKSTSVATPAKGSMKPPAMPTRVGASPGKTPNAKRVRSSESVCPPSKRSKPSTPANKRRVLNSPGNSMNFASAVFEIRLGTTDFIFSGHEGVLKKSPRFVQEMKKARNKPRTAHQERIVLDEHNVRAFEQMLNFLYSDKYASPRRGPQGDRLDELRETMSLAKHFQLPELQKQIVNYFAKSSLLRHMSTLKFLDWAEEMYYEELDHTKGPFKNYFQRHAPELLREARFYALETGHDDGLMASMSETIKNGGSFAIELFKATYDAMSLTDPPAMMVKKEEEDDDASMRASAFCKPSTTASREPCEREMDDPFASSV